MVQQTDANGIPSVIKWGYKSALPIAAITGATNTSTVAAVFDDGDVSHWGGSGTWQVSSGVYQQIDPNTQDPWWPSPRLYAGVTISDAVVEGDVRFDNSGSCRYAALIKWVSSTQYVRFELRKTDNLLRVWVMNWATTVYRDVAFTFAENTWYHIKGVVNGTLASLYCNGVMLDSLNHPVVAMGAGQVGLCTYYTVASFDNIRFHPVNALANLQSFDPVTLLKTQESGQDGNRTYYTYDSFQRPTGVLDGLGNLVKDYAYYYSRDGNGDNFSASDPNYVQERDYRNAADWTQAKNYTDGLANAIEKQVYFGTSDLNTVTTYDSLGRVHCAYKPYQKNSPGTHVYDASYRANDSVYYGNLASPFDETRYQPDPLNRAQLQGAPGTVWNIGSGHEVKIDYLSDLTNHWNITRKKDEQNQATHAYVDVFGNTVKSVVDSGGLSLTTSFTYDIMGDLLSSTPPNGGSYASSYSYNTLKQLKSKTTPDAGSTQYLYDRNGNLRLVQDANHTGTANSVLKNNNGQMVFGGLVETFTLTMPTQVSVWIGWRGGTTGADWVSISANGTVLLSLTTNYQNPSVAGSIILPKGTYTDSVGCRSGNSPCNYSVTASNGYEFIYNKYDALNRLIEQGEYVSTSASADFTQANADTSSFPTSNTNIYKVIAYDSVSSDPIAAGQEYLAGRISSATSFRLGQIALSTYYSYDSLGRVGWIIQKGLGANWKKIAYTYDFHGNVIIKSYMDSYSSTNNLITWYTYDPANRLSQVFSGPDFIHRALEATYTYNADGTVSRQVLGNSQGVDYLYNERAWLRQINHQNLNTAQDPGHDGPGGSGVPYVDKFGEVIDYNNISDIGYYQGATAQYNGNISWIMYNMAGLPFSGTSLVGNTYSYDRANRDTLSNFGYFTSSWQGTNSYDMPSVRYDKNGNISSLQRYGVATTLRDNFTYNYASGKNLLTSLTNAVGPATQYYTYDANGNMQSDSYRGVAFVVYDINNQPVSEYETNGKQIQYYYDANGQRCHKYDGSANTYYVAGKDGNTDVLTFDNSTTPTYNTWGRDNLGQVQRNGSTLTRFYYLKDHLGSIRMTVNSTGDTTSWDDYDAWGMPLEQRSGNLGQANAKYRFTGKELDQETGYDYFGARYYDARIGRWLSVDPLPDLAHSSYEYVDGNPILRVDEWGEFSEPYTADQDPADWERNEYAKRHVRQSHSPSAPFVGFERQTIHHQCLINVPTSATRMDDGTYAYETHQTLFEWNESVWVLRLHVDEAWQQAAKRGLFLTAQIPAVIGVKNGVIGKWAEGLTGKWYDLAKAANQYTGSKLAARALSRDVVHATLLLNGPLTLRDAKDFLDAMHGRSVAAKYEAAGDLAADLASFHGIGIFGALSYDATRAVIHIARTW